MRKLFYIGFILFFLASCSEGIEYPDPPKDLIPREKMIQVLKEMAELESYIQETYPGVNRFHKTMVSSVDSLFETHGVSHEQFESSIDYYASHQHDMAKMYDEAIQELSRELGELQEK